MKIIFTALGLVVFGLVFAFQYSTGSWLYQMTKAQDEINTGEGTDSKARLALGSVPPVVRWWSGKTKLNDTFNTSYLSSSRTVRMEIAQPFETILNAGEAIPEDVFKDVFVAARGPQNLIPLCAELLATIAVECDLWKPKGKLGKENLAVMSGFLRFIPADDPGVLPQSESAKVQTFGFSISDSIDIPYSAQGRIEALTRARLACDAVRTAFGNCVITDVRLEPETLTGKEALKNLRARVRVSIYTDRTDLERRDVRKLMERASLG